MKKILTIILSLFLLLSLSACKETEEKPSDEVIYNIGICNYVDDASLNQIVENIELAINQYATSNNVTINIKKDNCNADATVMQQIIANFIADDVDLMVAIATPVAMAMQAATEENRIPVIFAAVSDPVGCGIVDSLEKPGANLTGTSDYLDTATIMNLITTLNQGITQVGLLYDQGQDSSLTAIAAAKDYLNKANIEVVEKTGTNVDEIVLAADALIYSGVKVIFTPQDNTVMKAELAIYEKLAANGVQHYGGADSFALNGAFLGYGVDYANLGKATGAMVCAVLNEGADPAEYSVTTFDNGIATVNTETLTSLGLDFTKVQELIAPLCTEIKEIVTAESFE